MDTRQTYPDRESAHEIHGGNLTESAKNIWWTNVDVQLVMFLRKWKLALFLLDRMEEDKARRCKKTHIKVKIGLKGVEPHNNSKGFPLDIFQH